MSAIRCKTLLLALVIAMAGCGDDSGTVETCLDPLPESCDVLYQTYEQLFTGLLQPTCGSAATGQSCHGAEGGMAGLFLHDIDQSYDLLLGGGGRTLVIPGNPECSVLMQRVESKDPTFRMPPGPEPLSEEARCSLARWIAAGADRQ